MPVQATPVSHGGALPLWYPERPGKDHPFSGKGLHLSLGGGGQQGAGRSLRTTGGTQEGSHPLDQLELCSLSNDCLSGYLFLVLCSCLLGVLPLPGSAHPQGELPAPALVGSSPEDCLPNPS